jgi:hypothetical protein
LKKKLRRSRPSNSSKDKCREVVLLKVEEASQVGEQTTSLVERHDFFLFVELYEEERTDEIIRGDFAKFRGPLDLAEVQGGYGGSVKGSKLRRAER